MKKKVSALCIVAHPDDETIWMGGTIMQNQSWDWTIFSLCRKHDQNRMPKFKKVCDFFNAHSIISDLDDEILNPLPINHIVNKIKENLSDEKYDYVFTHGKNGEYGHIRHIETHRAVEYMTKNGDLNFGKLFNFSYNDGEIKAPHDSELAIPVANGKADWVIELNESIYQKKFDLITSLYGFSHPIFETLACGKEEAFQFVK